MKITQQKISQHLFWYPALAGLLALLIGVGLGRFSYTPLIPSLINQGWVSNAGAGYLGTINFAGYLVGAFFAHRLTKYLDVSIIIKISITLLVISLALCSIHLGFLWIAVWRFLAGIMGAFLMVLTPAAILKHIQPRYWGRASGIIFTGVGFGVVASGFLLPILAKPGVAFAWLGAAALALTAGLVAWPQFTPLPPNKNVNESLAENSSPIHSHRGTLNLLIGIYILFGIGAVPHTLFLVDYVHRQLNFDPVISGLFWSIFGMGSLVGPILAGLMADRLGIYKSMVILFVVSCLAISIILFNKITLFYVASSFLMGALFPGIVTLISAKIVELIGIHCHASFWGKMTLSFAISQALTAYIMSYLLHQGMGYTACFVIADIAFFAGLVLVIFT